MAYDEVLADRAWERLEADGVTAKKMFGAIIFLFQGNTLACIYEEGLMVRVGPEGMDEALAKTGARPYVFRGKEQKSWVVIDEETLDDDVLDFWLRFAMEITAGLPPK
ncbi:hypothetical protein CDO52_26790 [Nocardiopsis gilva YIM 90087]|uniref:TfoX N-terminal domain-containing protein n=1 Tax=Nocardiopsis gilva YIM 90087 TaxID=1235441 RepID=A0A223SCW2_9ACTN|nr:TfoX/Sxy family protein [Nocardiopsis gilva]ASU85925.1 hypothetical protein CDO52_26790 [Nocardiopsis gilva YIM 90087]